jgi:hypothetical protein
MFEGQVAGGFTEATHSELKFLFCFNHQILSIPQTREEDMTFFLSMSLHACSQRPL